MGEPLSMCVCPACGQRTLSVNTADSWKPREIKCRRLKCGWTVDLRQYWPEKKLKGASS